MPDTVLFSLSIHSEGERLAYVRITDATRNTRHRRSRNHPLHLGEPMPIHSPDKVPSRVIAAVTAVPAAHVLANLKAYVALVGMVATELLHQFTGSIVLTVIATVCTVFGVWAATNTPAE